MRTHLVLFAFLAAACGSSRWSVVSRFAGSEEASRKETHSLALAAGDRIELATPHGRIEARAVEGATPTLVATLRASGRTSEEAAAVLARYELALVPEQGRLNVALRGEPLRIEEGGTSMLIGASVDYVLTVPEQIQLTARTASGEISVEGPFGACDLETNYGAVGVAGARGAVKAKSGSGDVTLRGIRGDRVRAESRYGALRIDDVVADGIVAETSSGDLEIAKVRGRNIELETSYGAVSVRDAEGELRASTSSGNVELSGVRGEVAADSKYGQVAIEGVLTGVEARSSSGAVRVRALEGSATTSDWRVASGYGPVTLQVPADFGCRLEATTRHGEVSCAFPVMVDPGPRKTGSLHGVVGPGGRAVELTSASGNVALEKL